ncbi:MAG: bifunctional 5,10-methylenetetrahydrofolate dehydrogenase/5,10-methenyltetrahydrofolate cyclohydrolase [Parachlamydiaceae bacterium]|nr:bifunctional 5,10-methylenetetrahydrofolate dehydrogenase/5,10-methenyltetrahydrofolate cyclohydrolase [Parachlamydiaceae bacterium]
MIIDCAAIAAQIQQEIQQKTLQFKERKPCLAVILVGEHAPSKIYVGRKTLACANVGFTSIRKEFSEEMQEEDLVKEIQQLNNDPDVDGILLQLPLPDHIDPIHVLRHIDPNKDVDGLHPVNAGKLLIGDTSGFVPCTPLGIKEILMRSSYEVAGKHVVVIGRSNLVGKPVAALLMQNAPGANATVTLVHSKTKNIKDLCLLADVLIVAIGKAKFVTADMVKPNAFVIDVGINKIDNATLKQGYQIVGDVDFDSVKESCYAITPVPGGVGPMTIAMLLYNTLKSYEKRMLPYKK